METIEHRLENTEAVPSLPVYKYLKCCWGKSRQTLETDSQGGNFASTKMWLGDASSKSLVGDTSWTWLRALKKSVSRTCKQHMTKPRYEKSPVKAKHEPLRGFDWKDDDSILELTSKLQENTRRTVYGWAGRRKKNSERTDQWLKCRWCRMKTVLEKIKGKISETINDRDTDGLINKVLRLFLNQSNHDAWTRNKKKTNWVGILRQFTWSYRNEVWGVKPVV